MIDKSDAPSGARKPTACSDVRDVADFHLRWPEFRPIAKSLSCNPNLTATESDTLVWMIELLNRIGPQDLEDSNL
jgi:hypothetical protein